MAGLPPSIRSLIGLGGAGGAGPEAADNPLPDTSEQVIICSLALFKMLRHGRAGVPMEVMGLMLGEFVDEFTIRVVDVFSMPQSGNTVSVEAVDAVYQAEMLDMLKRVGRSEMVVGWYHSHPGFGCWFSNTDINTQQSFEQLNNRAIGVVIDPIQSNDSNIVIDCFRLIFPPSMLLGGGIGGGADASSRQITSNIGHCVKPTITALIHGLNKHYHSIVINYEKDHREQFLLESILKPEWTSALKPVLNDVQREEGLVTTVDEVDEIRRQQAAESAKKAAAGKRGAANEAQEGAKGVKATVASIKRIRNLVRLFKEEVKEDIGLNQDEVMHKRVGKMHAKKQLQEAVGALLDTTIATAFTATVSSVVY